MTRHYFSIQWCGMDHHGNHVEYDGVMRITEDFPEEGWTEIHVQCRNDAIQRVRWYNAQYIEAMDQWLKEIEAINSKMQVLHAPCEEQPVSVAIYHDFSSPQGLSTGIIRGGDTVQELVRRANAIYKEILGTAQVGDKLGKSWQIPLLQRLGMSANEFDDSLKYCFADERLKTLEDGDVEVSTP